MEVDDFSKIVQSLNAGLYDDQISDFAEAVGQRAKIVKTREAQQLFANLEVEDRVRVNAPHLKPRYLNGATGTVVEKRITKITVQFDDDIDDPYGKWAGKKAVLHPSMIVPIGD